MLLPLYFKSIGFGIFVALMSGLLLVAQETEQSLPVETAPKPILDKQELKVSEDEKKPEDEKKKKPKVIQIEEKTTTLFTSESELAKYSALSGDWRPFELDGTWMIRMQSETIQPCRVDFGPYLNVYDISISAKVLGKHKGRLKPRFGVGLFGRYGFFLRLSGGNEKLELVRYGEVLTSVPYSIDSDQWNYLELRVKAEKDHWVLIGRAWLDGAPRPLKPQISHKVVPEINTQKVMGRGNLTGSPFNGLPIYFDNIELKKIDQWASTKVVDTE